MEAAPPTRDIRFAHSKTVLIVRTSSAYVKPKAVKRPGESFSDVINRIFRSRKHSLLDLRGLLDRKSVDQLVDAIARMREEDIGAQKLRPQFDDETVRIPFDTNFIIDLFQSDRLAVAKAKEIETRGDTRSCSHFRRDLRLPHAFPSRRLPARS